MNISMVIKLCCSFLVISSSVFKWKCEGLSSLCEYIHGDKAVLLFLGHVIISIVVEMWWFEFIL